MGQGGLAREMRERKCLSIGIADFRDIRRNNFCYIDTTFFIQRLLDTQARIMLFTRPRRFGKTLALDTLLWLVCEFKCCEHPEQMPAKAEEARQQSEDKRYFANFAPEVGTVLGYGVAFCRKECETRQRKWRR